MKRNSWKLTICVGLALVVLGGITAVLRDYSRKLDEPRSDEEGMSILPNSEPEAKVKAAMENALERSGYKVGPGAEQTLSKASRQIAQSIEDLRNCGPETGQMLNNKKHGKWQAKYTNGQLQREGNYVEGEKDGIWRYYYPDGTKRGEEPYSRGVLHGKNLFYYRNGHIQYIEHYVDGKKQGIKNTWYENEILHMQTNFQDGYFHGDSRIWHPNGKIKKLGHFRLGRQHGEVKFYDEEGRLKETCLYENGLRVK